MTFDAKLDTLLSWKRALSTDMLNGASDLKLDDFGDLSLLMAAVHFEKT